MFLINIMRRIFFDSVRSSSLRTCTSANRVFSILIVHDDAYILLASYCSPIATRGVHDGTRGGIGKRTCYYDSMAA